MASSINCRWMPQIIGNLDFCATDHHFEPGALLCPVSQTCYHEKLSLVMHHLLFHESDEYSQLPCDLCAWTMGFRRIYLFHNLPRSLRVGWSDQSVISKIILLALQYRSDLQLFWWAGASLLFPLSAIEQQAHVATKHGKSSDFF